MSLELKLYEPLRVEDVYLNDLFTYKEKQILEFALLGYNKAEIAALVNYSENIIGKALNIIYSKFGIEGKKSVDIAKLITLINSALSLSNFIGNTNQYYPYSEIRDHYLFDLTDAQKLDTKLLLNGYTKPYIAEILDIGTEVVNDRLNSVHERFGKELVNTLKLDMSRFSFRSLVYLILLQMYAKGQLDTVEKEPKCHSNLATLITKEPNYFRPITQNKIIAEKLTQLRNTI
jgi:DNA-binding CsgD family transcriptional regulator